MHPIVAFIIFYMLQMLAFPVAAQKPTNPTNVFVTPVQWQSQPTRVEVLGNIRANESVVITTDIVGKVVELGFDDGDKVQKGDVVLLLEQSAEQAELRAAEAQLFEVKQAYERARQLRANKAVSDAVYNQRLATLRRVEAEIAAIQASIRDRTIRAPFDGVLGLREVSLGALVRPGDPITTLSDLSRMKIDFNVPALYLDKLTLDLPLDLRVPALPSRLFKGRLLSIDTAIDDITRTLRVRGLLENKDGILRPGLLAEVSIELDSKQVYLVPEEAIIRSGLQSHVLVTEQHEGALRAAKRPVKIADRLKGYVMIESGLAEGMQVIHHGAVKVKPGDAIKVSAVEQVPSSISELLNQAKSAEANQTRKTAETSQTTKTAEASHSEKTAEAPSESDTSGANTQ